MKKKDKKNYKNKEIKTEKSKGVTQARVKG